MSENPPKLLKLSAALQLLGGMSETNFKLRQKYDGAPRPVKLAIGDSPVARSTKALYLESDVFEYINRKVDQARCTKRHTDIVDQNEVLRQLNNFAILFYTNKHLIDAVCGKRTLAPEEFLWQESKRIVAEVGDCMRLASRAFGVEVVEVCA